MRLLIDTQALIWFCEGNPSLSSPARMAMEDKTNECYISHATPWEVAIKVSIGKVIIQVDFEALFPGVLVANGFELLAPSLKHYSTLITLPRHHGDPFDRLILSQAKVEGLTIVSCDVHFPIYGLPVLW